MSKSSRTKAPSADEPSMDLSSRLRNSKITDKDDKDDKYASRSTVSTSTRAKESSRSDPQRESSRHTSSRGTTSGGQSSSHYPVNKLPTIKELTSRGTVHMSTVDNPGKTVHMSKIDSTGRTAHMSKIDSTGRTVHMSKIDEKSERPRHQSSKNDRSEPPRHQSSKAEERSEQPRLQSSKDDRSERPRLQSSKDDRSERPRHQSSKDDKSERPRLESSKDDRSERPRQQSSKDDRSERPRQQSSKFDDRSEHSRHHSSSAIVPKKSSTIRPITATRAPSHVKSVFRTPDDAKMASRQTKYTSLTPAEREKQERWVQSLIRHIGACPAQLAWQRVDVHRYYRCRGGNHVITDESLAEGKGGMYFLPAQTLPHKYCDAALWGPYYPGPTASLRHGGPTPYGSFGIDPLIARLGQSTTYYYSGPKPKPNLAPDWFTGAHMEWKCQREREAYSMEVQMGLQVMFQFQPQVVVMPFVAVQTVGVQVGYPAPLGFPGGVGPRRR